MFKEVFYELGLSCAVLNGQFRVFIIMNKSTVEITEFLSERELREIRERFDHECLQDWACGPEK